MPVDPALLADEEAYCKDCPLRDQPYVMGRGYSKSPSMVIGTAPGHTEEMTGISFTGRHGALVRELLEAMGVDEDHAYYTNVIKRRPVTEGGQQRKPNSKECYKCGSHLVHEIVRNRPRVVLALGSIPLAFLIPDSSATSRTALHTTHGLPIPVARYAMQLRVIPTYDPSYVMRMGGLTSALGNAWVEDLEEFARLCREY